MDAETAATALRFGRRVRGTTAYGKVYEGVLDGHWVMAKAGCLDWQRYYRGSVPQGDHVQLGREFWSLRFEVTGPGARAGLESSVEVTLDQLELVEDDVKIEPEESENVTQVTPKVTPTTTVGDHTWCLKSTTVERGTALLQVALEWAGDDAHRLDEDEAVDHATEQLINLLAVTTHHFGSRAALKVISQALESAEDWDERD